MGLGAGASAASAAETAVSLTFKDTLISQYDVRQVLTDNDVDGTFYVNSGLVANRAVDITERMSWKQIWDLASDGNEIGGGSRSRLQLDLASAAELHAEICDDRAELIRRGYAPVSFGYARSPQDATPAAQAKVEECGYASARSAGGIGGAGNPLAESIPPENAFAVRARVINETHALATIKSWVTSAETTGGWLPLVITSVCDDPGCSITPANFEELVEWLKDRETLPGGGTHVKTVRDVMTGTEQPQPPDPIGTTISLAFDDGLDEHSTIAGPEMVESGVRGTFFVNSGNVETGPNFATWNQIRSLDGAGHEIGGHSINDTNLAGLPANTLNTEVCQDRRDIYEELDNVTGFDSEAAPVSYAYSFGAFDAAAKAKVANVTTQCTGFPSNGSLGAGDPGYLSGRTVQGLKWYTRTNRCQLLSCKFDESIHPADPYETKVIGSVGTDDTLPELQQTVENLFNSGGGWATLVFHEICPGPDPETSGCPLEDSSTTPEIFEGFTDWLGHTDQTSRGIEVKTIEQVMEGAAEPRPPFDDDDPVTSITCNAGACGSPFSSNGPVTVALSGSDTGPDTSGLKEIRYEVNGVPTGSSPIYTGPFQVNSSATVRFRASDNYGNVEKMKSQEIIVDQTAPTSSILCNGLACNSHYPTGTVDVTLSASDGGGTGVANIHYTTDDSEPTIASPTYTGTPIPVSVSTQIRFRAIDNVGNLETPAKSQTIRIDGAQPESSVLCDGSACGSGFYGETVQATLSATDFPAASPDASGVKNIRYTTDGNDPTGSSPIYTGAIPLSDTTTLKFRAEDNAGNVESPVESQLIKVDTVPAESIIKCDGAPCSLGGYDHVVRVELEASSDPGTAQPTEIRYTTDGSTPTGSSTLYTGEFFISETSTVKFFSLDEAGNAEPVKSQLVRIDLTPPVSAINCNGAELECQDAYNSAVQIHLSAIDPGDGGGAAEIRYTTDGSAPTAASTLYTGPFMVSGNGSHTIRFFSTDFAGNVESPDKSRTILIETTPPTSAMQCNGSPCIAGFYNAPVTGTLSADDGVGSGVKNIRFTTNGSDVTGSSPLYTGSFMINGVTTVKFRAEDNAGNLETQNTQVVNVDTQSPTTTITCDTDGPGGSAPASCLTSYPNGVDAVLDALDAGASGIDEIRYTTNGSDPTGSSTLYTGPIDVDSTTLLKWRATDNAGNVESPIKSRNIIIDTVDPTLATTCNGDPCIGPAFEDGPVSLALNGNDTGGSGLNDVRYTTDGSAPDASSTLYGGPIALNATTTVRWRVSDNAGRVVTGTEQVNIDQIDPTTGITCNGSTCDDDPPYTAAVTIALSGNDTGGSGLDDIRYTTDGSTPTASSTLYTAPFVINSTTTVRWRVADNAGNAVTQSESVAIDLDGPETTLQCNNAACSPGGYNAVVRVNFDVNSEDAPSVHTYFTLDGSEPTATVEDEWDGQDFFLSENTTVKFFSTDSTTIVEPTHSENVVIDTENPTSSIECNGVACQDFYNAAVSVSLEGEDEGGIGEIRYTTDGSAPTASSTLYTGAFPVSGNGVKTIRWFAKDTAGNSETPSNTESFTIEDQDPTTTAACNGGACGGFFDEDVNVALTANDGGGAGVKEIRYTTDGTAPNASSTLYSGPIPLTSSTLVRFRAEDNAGNLEAVKDEQVNIDKLQPDSTIECDGSACVGGSAYYEDTVSVELAGTDSGDSGVDVIRYTTDGSDPTGSSTVYAGPFNVAQTSTVKFRAEDNAGNVESPVNTQEIKIENGPPVSSIQCNGVACQNAYNAPVAATLSATDDASGVDEIRYTTDGSEPNGTSTLYTGAPIPVNATTTIKFFANDVAGEVEAPAKSRTIVIDNAAPASGILCNGAACGGPYKSAITATITASDTGGAGVKEIRYTTDGSNPTAASPLYTGPIPVSTSSTIKWRAEDNAGNLEATKSQAIDFQNVAGIVKCKKPKNKKNKKALKKYKKCKKKQKQQAKKQK